MMYSQETIDAVIDECGDFNSRFYPNEAVVRLVLEALESTAEQKALRADAERYRHWRDAVWFGENKDYPGNFVCIPDTLVHAETPEQFDEAIDKARDDRGRG